ncbi:hypothetical protein F2Q69_00012080 [Brassica cretica]|uniref:Uncharacterized protein n=1 Tax=Brassica cretica TaxID=69181 RepID=A0A8S9R478_BRACR|nr:hypothetical protein F2Q69_00012080 [Brassica cretica]
MNALKIRPQSEPPQSETQSFTVNQSRRERHRDSPSIRDASRGDGDGVIRPRSEPRRWRRRDSSSGETQREPPSFLSFNWRSTERERVGVYPPRERQRTGVILRQSNAQRQRAGVLDRRGDQPTDYVESSRNQTRKRREVE